MYNEEGNGRLYQSEGRKKMNNLFVERIKGLIEKIGVTQRDLAQDIGVTESTLSKYLKGERTPNRDVLLNIATALNTTSDYLLGLSDTDKETLNFNELKGILARNSKDLSAEQKTKLIEVIIKYR